MKLEVSDKCVGCGACAADCPVGVLAMSDGRPVAMMFGVPAVRYAISACRRGGARVEML